MGELAVTTEAPTFDEWWARTTALAGPLSGVLAGLPAGTQAAVTDHVRAAVEPYRSSTGALTLPGVSLVGSATA